MSIETKGKYRILTVDDSITTLEVIQRNLTAAGCEVFTCTSVDQAVAFLESQPVDLVITDLKMPRASGMDLVKHVRENLKNVEVMLITGYPSIAGAVEAIKDGAEDYLVKPFTDGELLSAVSRMLEKRSRRRAVQSGNDLATAYGIIGRSKEMQTVFHRIEKASATDANVLISGESGTGKELVARAVHYRSDRRATPFVPINCTAIPENLLESELFGHVKGAFTGAKDHRTGFFQIADGGTIFLDEIGDASPNMQGKLLRVMQSKEFSMVGSSRIQTVDTRILAATHKDLMALVQKNLFREDLYYRLDVIDIQVPPLRDRGDDILLLVSHLARKFANDLNRPMPEFSDNALQAMKDYPWPGNVRELENLIQRLLVISDGDRFDMADLPGTMRYSYHRAAEPLRPLAEVETEHLQTVLTAVGGNKTRAAEILGIDRKTLREKLKRNERRPAEIPAMG